MKNGNVAVLLVRPENTDNIGATARAVKNMGFSELRLVKPPSSWRSKGKKMAMAAGDILTAAREFPALDKAIQDLSFVVGTTRRRGKGRGCFYSFPDTVSRIREKSERFKIGIVFGCESKGLSNRDLDLCDWLVTIPSSPQYPSLNLAQAVMVLLFSLSSPRFSDPKSAAEKFLSKKETRIALKHFEGALQALGYRRGGNDLLPRILKTMDGLLKRGGLLAAEAQMIKGLSRRIREKVLSCETDKDKMTSKES